MNDMNQWKPSLLSLLLLPTMFVHTDGILIHTPVTITTGKACRRVEEMAPQDVIETISPKDFTIEHRTLEHSVVRSVDHVTRVLFNHQSNHVDFSPYQRLYVPFQKKWIDARKLQPGDAVLLRDTSLIYVDKVDKIDKIEKTYVLIMTPGEHILVLTPLEILTKNSDKTIDLREFFRRNEPFAQALAQSTELTPWSHKSARIYRITQDLPEYGLFAGYLIYLDMLHFDHLEVFNSTGTMPTNVLNLDGSNNEYKFKIAQEQQRTLIPYMTSLENNHSKSRIVAFA